ncbi:hypothetical protein ACNQGP_07395 [Flavobacterium sp. GT2N3]|uniref:hypothetical protein n=1 Tax=unclassified Flavobacterium TaxID=196869 RepID=UPI003AAEAE81
MKKIFTFLTLGILLFSCSSNEEEIVNDQDNFPLITKMSPYNLTSENQSGLYTYFEYDNAKRLTKKSGGFIEIGIKTFYYNEIYTSLIYDNTTVTVENFTTFVGKSVPKESIYITLNKSMQIEKKEIPHGYNDSWRRKLVYYYLNNKLVEIKTTFPNTPYTFPDNYLLTYSEKFNYNSNGNLIKAEYFEQRNGVNKGEKIVRIFENYDNSINPLKRFYLLDQYFYGSISKNNYRKYTEIHYDDDVITTKYENNWQYLYDKNGNILVN